MSVPLPTPRPLYSSAPTDPMSSGLTLGSTPPSSSFLGPGETSPSTSPTKRMTRSVGFNPSAPLDGEEGRRLKVRYPRAAGPRGESMGDAKAAALAHVPCRFFKAGQCDSGDKCPFSHALGEGVKKEICQWYLKGNCKFGHKCALAHVRPGEPMSMDRKNKRAEQMAMRERQGVDVFGSPHGMQDSHMPRPDGIASPVPIRSALSSSLQTAGPHRTGPSPMREPYGPPPPGPSGGFRPGFSSSPSRPSPLAAPFSRPGHREMHLKSYSTASIPSPLRPSTAGPGGFMMSSSFSSPSISDLDRPQPLSASFAEGGPIRRPMWAKHEEALSPARRAFEARLRHHEELDFDDDVADSEDTQPEDLLPSSLTDLLTPTEKARRMSRRDSQDSRREHSPPRIPQGAAGERLAQSGPPEGFLQNLWSTSGADARKIDKVDGEPLLRNLHDPASPSSKAFQQHAPGQSLPGGGLATALSRLHLQGSQPHGSSGLSKSSSQDEERPAGIAKEGEGEHDEGLFTFTME